MRKRKSGGAEKVSFLGLLKKTRRGLDAKKKKKNGGIAGQGKKERKTASCEKTRTWQR